MRKSVKVIYDFLKNDIVFSSIRELSGEMCCETKTESRAYTEMHYYLRDIIKRFNLVDKLRNIILLNSI